MQLSQASEKARRFHFETVNTVFVKKIKIKIKTVPTVCVHVVYMYTYSTSLGVTELFKKRKKSIYV